jgi:thiol-disulfide isomerase/thioredoxin
MKTNGSIIRKIILLFLFLLSSFVLISSILKEHRIMLSIGVLLISAGSCFCHTILVFIPEETQQKGFYDIYPASFIADIFSWFSRGWLLFLASFIILAGLMGYFAGVFLILKRFKAAAIVLATAFAFIAIFHFYLLPKKFYLKNLDRFISKKESYNSLRFYYLDGSLVDTVDYKGKIILLNFWFTGCVPCETKKPAYSKLYEHYRSYPEVFIADIHANMLNYITIKEIEKNLSKTGYSVPVLYDFDSFLAKEMGVTSMPVEVILDKNLKVVSTYSGYDRYDSKLYLQSRMRIIDSLLAVK